MTTSYTCNCPVERPHAPHGAYFSSPRCVLPETHTGDHRAADGSTCSAYMGGSLAWWIAWLRVWKLIGNAVLDQGEIL